MSTKLVISVDGLLLTNQNTVVSSRSLDEVILVGTSAQFNNLTSDQRTQILSRKASNIGGSKLSLALANESTASFDDDFYNWLSTNNFAFYNDPGLQSLSSAIILTSNGSETFTSISAANFADFNTTTLSSNSLYTAGSSLDLGSNFGSKPTITVSTPTFLDDLSGSIAVNISAAQFATILAANTDGSKVSVADIVNLAVSGDTSNPDAFPLPFHELEASDVTANYDGTNRLGNTSNVSSDYSLPGGQNGSVYFGNAEGSPITISVLQALRLPLMGAAPYKGKVTLTDTAENLSLGLKAFTEGQIASFNEILVSDGGTLVLDPTTFKNLDTANIQADWSIHDGTTVINSSGTNAIQIKGTYADFVSNGLWDGSLASSLTTTTDAANLLAQVNSFEVSGVISSASDVTNHISAIKALKEAGATVTTNLTFSSSFNVSGITAATFIELAELDSLTSQSVITGNFVSGININDSSENIKSLITNTSASVIAVKSSISGLTSTTDNAEKIILSWDEYVGALTGASFDSATSSTWSISGTAFQNLQNVELIVTGTASEIKNIVDTYAAALTSFPSGLTFKVLDGNSLTLTQAQLDQLDARIDGVVVVSDTSSGIGTLLNNAIPTSVQQINPVDSSGNSTTLVITFDQFRNLPNYFSDDVVIKDSEDNIVAALNEDLLDDRVTTLVINTGTDSTTLGKATTAGGSTSTADSALTVTAAAAKNILSKKVYSQVNYDAGNTTSYMDISIVDRGSAIANFIETASFPGASSAADVTGSIDFVEKDGGSITLTYNQKVAYDAIPTGILKSSLTTTPAIASINLSSIAESITSLSTALSNAESTIVLNTDTEVSTAQAAIIADTGATESTLSTALSNAESTIIADTGATESTLSTALSNAESTIVLNTDTEVNDHVSTAQAAIIADTGATESTLSTALSNAESTIIADTGATESTLSTALSNAESTIVLNTDTEVNDHVSTAQAAIIADTGATESTLSTALSNAESTIIADTGATESTLSTALSNAESTIIADTGATESTLSTALSNAESTIVLNTDTEVNDHVSTAQAAIIADTGNTESTLSTALSNAESTIVLNTDTEVNDHVSTAQAAIIADTGNTESTLSTALSNAESTIVLNTDTEVNDHVSTAQAAIIADTGNTESTLSTALSNAESTIVLNTDTEVNDHVSTAQAAIIADTGNTESTLSTALSNAESTIVLNTDTEVNDHVSTAQAAIIADTGNTESTLSTALSNAESTIVLNTDTEVNDHVSTAQAAIIADTGNTESTLSSAIANEKLTRSEFASSLAANSDIVDTHDEILTLLGSALHSNIRSIDILSGDTLKLTSAQFQVLKDAESNPGELFSGKIKLATTLTGTYTEVYNQITDYRIALEEGFAASEYSTTVSGTITVAQAETLRVAGLTMSNQTYSIKDTLALLKAQADSDTGGVLASAAGVEFMTSEGAAVVIDDDTATNHSNLNTIAGVANGVITATVQGTGANLADGTLSNLASTDQITFRIQTSATPGHVTTLSGLTKDSYLIDFSTNNAVVSGAYTDFITKGAATVTTNYTNVLDHTASAPISLSGITVNSGDADATPAKIAADLKKLTDVAEGPVTVTITNGTDSILDATVEFSSDDAFTISLGTLTASDSIITAINALADQNSANGLTNITGTLNSLTATQAGNLSSNITSSNSTLSFNMKADSTGTLGVVAADALLDHTNTSTATVNFGGGIEDALSAFATGGSTTDEINAIVAEDTDVQATVTGTLGSTSDHITDLNALASKFNETGLTNSTIVATISTDKDKLYNSSTGAAIIATDSNDTIGITVTDVIGPTAWAAIKAKTGSTVTADAGFSAGISEYASDSATTSAWNSAVGAPNAAKPVVVTGTLSTAAHIAALNLLTGDTDHTGAGSTVTATVEAGLSTIDPDNLNSISTDPIAFTVTGTLNNGNVADLNTLKGKTAGKITINSISATASELGSLNTTTTDSVTLTASGTSNTVADAIILANKTDALSKITIAGISDTQTQISGNGTYNATALTNLKTLVGSSPTTAQAIDSLYNNVTGSVTITGGAISVDNAINISSFTVGTSPSSAISYDISDTAGDDSGDIGLATTSSDVNRAIANASNVTQTGTALTIDQAKEMLEDADGNALTSVGSKFTYAVSDTYTTITAASDGTSGAHARLAHDTAAASNGVTLTAGPVADLIGSVSGLVSSNSVYTVRDSLDNLTASTANIGTLLSKAASIVVTDELLNGDDSGTRDKIRTLVSRAVDGTDAVPITATMQGSYDRMLGTLATDGSSANPVTFTSTRQDDITLGIKTDSHTVAEIALLNALTKQTTMSLVGGVGIADSLTNLLKDNNTSASDNLADAISALSSPPVTVSSFTMSTDDEITRLNSLAALTGIGAITATVTDTSGTFILDSTGTLLGMTDDDAITINLTDTGFTFTDNQVTRLSSIVNATGVSSITGSATISSTRAATVGAINDSSNKIAVNFTLSEQTNIANASALVGNTSGNVTFHSNGISNALSGFVDSSASSGLSSGWTAIKNEDGAVNITVTGFTDPVEATEITQFNTAAAETTGTITASITGIGTRLAALSTSAFGGADPLTLTITDNVSVSNFNTIDGRTNQDVTLNTGIEDTFSALHDGTNPVSGVRAAVADDNDIMIKVSDKVTANFSRINDLEAITDFTGKITATLEGSADDLAHATNLNNLSDATGAGHTADDITFNVIGDASLDQMAVIAGRTSRTDITVTGNVTGAVSDFIKVDNSDETKHTTLKNHTAGEPIAISNYTVDGPNAIDRVNALLSGAEGTVTGTIVDSGNSVLSFTSSKRIQAQSGDSITVNIGTAIDPNATNLTQLKELANQSGITSITGSMTISAADIDTIITGTDFQNLTTSNCDIDFTLDDKVTAAQAAGLASKVSSTGSVTWHSIEDAITGLIKNDGSAVSDNLATALAKDNTVSVNITTSLDDSAHVLGINKIVAGIHSANTVTATLSLDKSEAAQFSGVSSQPLTITVSDAMSVSEFNTLNGVTHSSKNITLTSGISDSIGNLVPSAIATALQAAIDQDAGATLNVTITPEVTADHSKVSTLAASVPGSITGAISGTPTQLTGITGLSDSNDVIDFTVTDDSDVADLATIAGDTTKTNITFSSGKGIADTLANLINNGNPQANLTTALNHLASPPTIALTTVVLSSNNNIVDFNALTSQTTGGVTGQLTDNNGQYLLATTGEGVTAPVTTADDDITFAYGSTAASDAKITKLLSNADLSGTTTFTGTLTGITSTQAASIGNKTALNAGGSGNNTSTMNLTVSDALGLTAAANIAGKGSVTYSGGLTGAVTDYATAASSSAFQTAYNTARTEMSNVAINITNSPLATADEIRALNKAASGTTGNVTAIVTTTAAITDLLSIDHGSRTSSVTVTINNAALLSQYDTAQAATDTSVQITGKLEDSLSNLTNSSDNTLKTNVQTLVNGDKNVNIELNDTSITNSSSGFTKLNNIAGATGHTGKITATVSGSATDILANLGNLSTNGVDDSISFTVTGATLDTAATSLQSIDALTDQTVVVSDITDSITDVGTAHTTGTIDISGANITLTGTISKANYTTADGYNTAEGTTVSFSHMQDSYSNLLSMDSALDGKTITLDSAITVAELANLKALNPTTINYDITDTRSNILNASDSDLTNAGTVTVNTTETLSIANIAAINTKMGGDPSYSTVTDTAAVLSVNSGTTPGRIDGKTVAVTTNSTATEYRQILTNANGGSVSGAVVDTDYTKLLTGTVALSGATSIKLTVQSTAKDFTGSAFLGTAGARLVDFDLNGNTGVLFNIDDIDGRTITDSGSGGTYFINDTLTNINNANAKTGANASDADQFKALYGATEIQVNNFSLGDDLKDLGNTTANQTAATNHTGMSGITTTDIKITLTADTTVNDANAAKLTTVTKVDLNGDDVDLTIEGDAFDNAGNEWEALTTITGVTGNTNNSLVISDDTGNSGGTLDLYGIATLTNIDSVTITGDSGANIINLSPGLTTDGLTTINLGASDTSIDKIYFGVDDSDFTKADTAGIIKYTTVNDFEVGYDRIGLYYYGDSDSPVSAVNKTARTGSSGGTSNMAHDRSFIEDDSNTNFAALTSFNDVSEIKDQIATALADYSVAATDANSRLMYAHYTFDESAGKNYAVINAADFTGISPVSNVTSANSDFEVVGIAVLAGVSEGSLGTVGGGLNGYNLTASKPTGLAGAS